MNDNDILTMRILIAGAMLQISWLSHLVGDQYGTYLWAAAAVWALFKAWQWRGRS